MGTGKLCILDMGIWAYGTHCNDSSAFRALPPHSICWWSTKSTRIIAVCSVCPNTHVQYTQTDTIRQTDGPLVPMVRLVPIENDVIPMVLLVNVHLIKGDLDYFPMRPGWVQGNSDGPLLPMARLVPIENDVIDKVCCFTCTFAVIIISCDLKYLTKLSLN